MLSRLFDNAAYAVLKIAVIGVFIIASAVAIGLLSGGRAPSPEPHQQARQEPRLEKILGDSVPKGHVAPAKLATPAGEPGYAWLKTEPAKLPECAFRNSFENWLVDEKRPASIEVTKLGQMVKIGDNRYRLCELQAPAEGGKAFRKFLFQVYSDDAIVKGYSEEQIPAELNTQLAALGAEKWEWQR